MAEIRTKRRYAHELYPEPADIENRPLSSEVPYLYARAVGLDINGTGWTDVEPRTAAGDRIDRFVMCSRLALLSDALYLGFAGDAAWAWANQRMTDDSEWVYERAAFYGVPLDDIKPYPCGPEPDHHDHYGPEDARGWRQVFRTPGKESECPECTEPVLAPELTPEQQATVDRFGIFDEAS